MPTQADAKKKPAAAPAPGVPAAPAQDAIADPLAAYDALLPGSDNLTSDYDVTVMGGGSAAVAADFNAAFARAFGAQKQEEK